MNYRLTSARLLVATYGDIDPVKLGSPHMLALTHDRAKDITPVLQSAQTGWKSKPLIDPAKALSEARAYLSEALLKALGGTSCEVTGNEIDGSYKPIYDENGKIVGHETVSWILIDGKSLDCKAKTPGGKAYGMVACIFLAVVPA